MVLVTAAIASAVASPWVGEPGALRLSAGAWGLHADRQFAGGEARGLTGPLCRDPVWPGQRMPFSCVNGGTYALKAAALDGAFTVHRSVAIDLTLPALTASFADDIGQTRTTGLGDVRLGTRLALSRGRFVSAAALHVELPTGPGGFADRDVPLGDGQFDVIPGLRGGVAGQAWWAEAWQAFAVRLPNSATGIDPGDEWQGTLAAGGRLVPYAGAALRIEWLAALPDQDTFGLFHPGRSLVQARISAFAQPIQGPSRPLWLELGVAVPVAGRRWPAGAMPFGSVAWTFDLARHP